MVDIKCDYLIIGGGTSGCAAAYTAAQLGYKVILVEKSMQLGGSMTSSLVIPSMKCGNNQINTDFYNTIVNEMKSLNAQITFEENQGWFNPHILKIVLDKILINSGVQVLFDAEISEIKIFGRHISSLKVISSSGYSICDSKNLSKILSEYTDKKYTDNIIGKDTDILSVYIAPKYVIDTTGNSKICKKIKCKFINDKNKIQPVNLRFIMSGVDTYMFGKWLLDTDSDRNASPIEFIDGRCHFSTAYTWDSNKHWAMEPIFKKAIDDNTLKPADTNYFQIFTVAGCSDSVAFNCPRVELDNNSLTAFSISKALLDARSAIFRLAEFSKKYLPGFKNSYISDIADSAGIRVSERVEGKYILTKDDILTGKKFKNPVVISNYPIDVHSTGKDKSVLKQTGEYQIPVECLMVKGFDNLFVAGRSLSADFEAQAAARVQASCFSMGEGLVKYLAGKENKSDD